MFQGNWTCSKCGGAITQLPFQPRSDNGLTCRDCYFKEKNGGAGASTSDPAPAGDTSTGGAMDDREAPPFDPDAAPAGEPAPAAPEAEGTPMQPGERKMFEGDWTCSGCGNAITKLPFEPRNTENLKCIDCFKNSKA